MPSEAFEKDNAVTRAMRMGDDMNRDRPMGARSRQFSPVEPAVRTGAMLAPEGVPPPMAPAPTREWLEQAAAMEAGHSVSAGVGDRLQVGTWRVGALPDFDRPPIIDLTRGVVILDGLEVAIPAEETTEIHSWAIQLVADEVGRRLAHALAQLNGAHEAAQMLQMRKGQGETGLQSAEGDEPWPAEHVPPMSEGSKHLAESWAEPSPESDPPAPPPVLGGAKMVYDTEPSGDPLLDLWNPAMGPPPVAVPRKRKPRTQRPAVAGSRGAGKQQ